MIWGGAGEVRIEIKCTINVMYLDHPETIPHLPRSMENLSSMKPVPDVKKAGDHSFIVYNSVAF